MELEPLHELILDFIAKTNLPIFLTGKAGTGKTTFLRHIRQVTEKNLAVVAPTAVAAINAGGVTIHSFFQMPFGPIPPPTASSIEFSAKSFGSDKTKLIKCLDLLIIDEISMVRADTMDYIDRVLRFVKGSSRPFGGIQLLMIGDLYQLPPVFQNEWHLLSRFYKGPYFFDSQIFQQTMLLTFELTKVHRQSDPTFIEILNQVRNGKISDAQLSELNAHYQPTIEGQDLNDHVTLTTHNPLVKLINEQRLEALPGSTATFKAKIAGDFPQEAYPTEEQLILKTGAMVMFIKNDSSGEKKFYNGRTAKVEQINGENITVSFLDDGSTFDVTTETWENTKYALSETDQKVTQSSAGSFSQYPLRLAWAITIHKSQGLTFDKAVVDAGAAFAHGQTYVALSRCRTLDGLILKQKIEANNIITDPAVVKFMEQVQTSAPDQQLLETTTAAMESQYLIDCFDFAPTLQAYHQLEMVLIELFPNNLVNNEKLAATTAILEKKINEIAQRFVTKELNNAAIDLEINNRIKKAASYFLPHLTKVHGDLLELHQTAEGTPYHPDYFPLLNQTIELLETKVETFKLLAETVDVAKVNSLIKNKAANYKAIDGWKKKTPEIVVENPILYAQLLEWRKKTAAQKKVLDYHIISDLVLADISAKLPKTLIALSKVKSVGEGKASAYGEPIIGLIKSYLGESDLFG